jgi:transposase-like protein
MKQDPRERAYNLYFHTNLTQQQIAERAGVSSRTIYEWMKQGNWKTLKATSRIMPAQVVDDIYKHISHLNWTIKNRPFEERYPTKAEAETLRKLIFCIPRVKLNVSRGESAQAMMNFVGWLEQRNKDAAIYFTDFIDEYLHAPRKKGAEPYEFEYDADQYYNPADFPWRTQHTFEEHINTSNTSLRGTKQSCHNSDQEAQPEAQEEQDKNSPPYFQGGVPAEPNEALAGGGGSPLTQEKIPPLTALSPASSAGGDSSETTNVVAEQGDIQPGPAPQPRQSEISHNVPPSPLVEKGPGDEVNPNQTTLSQPEVGRSKQEALSTSPNTPETLAQQASPPDISTQTTSENKNDQTGSEQETIDHIQKVFDSWQKEINKNKRRR